MADETTQNPNPGFDEEKFQANYKNMKEAVEKSGTPLSHGAFGEFLFMTGVEEHMKEAIPELQIAADAGYASAKAYLGDAHLNGKGVEKDFSKAFDLLFDASLEGDVDATYLLGVIYFRGTEVEPDYEKARDFFADSASKGNSGAMNCLGLIFLGGFGVEQNIPKAKRYFQKAMEHNNVNGKKNLDMIKEQGRRFNYHDFILMSFAQKEE